MLNRRRIFHVGAVVFLISLITALIWVNIDSQRRISMLETTENGLTSTVNQLYTTVNDLGSNVSILNATVNALNATVNQLETNANDLNSTVNELNLNINSLETTVNSLANKVGALENMTWHSSGSYVLSQSSPAVTFNTQGEEWRMNYTFNGSNLQIAILYNLRVIDSSENIVGGLNGIELADLRSGGSGTIYIPEGQGTYSVVMSGITGNYTFTFTVQSYY